MIRYWPMSVICNSPLLPPVYIHELHNIIQRQQVSPEGFNAALEVASRTPHMDMPDLAVVESVDRPITQVFKEYPTDEEWERLERCGIFQATDGRYFVHIHARH
jgi:hypothetical protein